MNFDVGNNHGKGLHYPVPNGRKAPGGFLVFTISKKMQNGEADRLTYDEVRKNPPNMGAIFKQ